MANKRVNVLVYSGNGTTIESVRHCLYSLRRLLSPNYAVIPVDGNAIIKEPWISTCALLVIPGGADLPYCRTLNGEGNRRISRFINAGGAYLGLCAGGYYASKRCEFMVGDPKMEVVGDRELAFYPDTCRGLAFPGFVYHSEAGARACELKVNKAAFATEGGRLPETFKTYFNGGGVYINGNKYKERNVEVLAEYTEPLNVDSGDGAAAVVYCKVGEGRVILTGPHPEFAAVNLNPNAAGPEFKETVKTLEKDEQLRSDFFKACLLKLGLQVNPSDQAVPSLSRLHLSSAKASDVAALVSSWQEIVTMKDGEEFIKGENDTLHLEDPDTRWSMSVMKAALSDAGNEPVEDNAESGDRIIDYNKVIKRLASHKDALPSTKETPYFNHNAFYSSLSHYNSNLLYDPNAFGRTLLYGEVVTSTSTMLERNPAWLKLLPTGFTFTATTQVAGRGRGSNVWVSPPGSLMFSTVIRHPMALVQSAPVVFIQYLAALAIVQGIQSYDRGYSTIPVKLKWPNDIYALDPLSEEGKPSHVKIGGILVNSSYSGGDYTLVVGIGINVANAAPTTGLNVLASKAKLPPFQGEKLLARILTSLKGIYGQFCRSGWDRALESQYYKNWLHSDQIVTLEAEGGVKARVKGITSDFGLLLAEELGWEDRPTGKVWQLQSDSNSFDFFKGLLKRKV